MDVVITQLQSIANTARREFETGAIPRTLLVELYSRYNPGVEIDSFLSKAAGLFPALNCGLASVYLQHVLDQGGIIHGSYSDYNHTFLKIDGLIIDITADQFGGPEIYIGPLRNPWSMSPRGIYTRL